MDNLNTFLSQIFSIFPNEIISQSSKDRFSKVCKNFPSDYSNILCFEYSLCKDSNIDLSLYINDKYYPDIENIEIAKNYKFNFNNYSGIWAEFDYKTFKSLPGIFLSANKNDLLKNFDENLFNEKFINLLKHKVSQIGYFPNRNEKYIRFVVNEFLPELLELYKWNGNLNYLIKEYNYLNNFLDFLFFDFDFNKTVGPKIGLEFTVKKDIHELENFLLSSEYKINKDRLDILKYINKKHSSDNIFPMNDLVSYLSHIKFVCELERIVDVKVYTMFKSIDK